VEPRGLDSNQVDDYFRLAEICKAMGNPIRYKLLALLCDNVCNVNDLVAKVNLEQYKVSKHLAVLLAAGLVDYKVDGRKRCYGLVKPEVVRRIFLLFKELEKKIPKDKGRCLQSRGEDTSGTKISGGKSWND